VLLLHGWIATADLNWWNAYAELGRHFRVIAMDLRGHGRGLRGAGRFSFAGCAGDAAATLAALGAAPAIVVGYSMGGPIAQVTWRDHPTAVRGLVLCATSGHFRAPRRERRILTAMAYTMAYTPPPVRRRLLAYFLARARREDVYSDWLMSELAGHRMTDVLEAGRELQRFDSSGWIGAVDVPTSCLVMQRDDIVPPHRQYALAAAIPGASVRELDADHLACALRADLFVPALVAACREVAARSEPRAERGGAA
jgi:3-oxoadipate enol-lactonase